MITSMLTDSKWSTSALVAADESLPLIDSDSFLFSVTHEAGLLLGVTGTINGGKLNEGAFLHLQAPCCGSYVDGMVITKDMPYSCRCASPTLFSAPVRDYIDYLDTPRLEAWLHYFMDPLEASLAAYDFIEFCNNLEVS